MGNETNFKPGISMVEVECLMDCRIGEAGLSRTFKKGLVTVEARHFDLILSRYPQHFRQQEDRRFLSGAKSAASGAKSAAAKKLKK